MLLRPKRTVLDLFCGAGGLSAGFELQGHFETVAGIDTYKAALDTFYRNHQHASDEFSTPNDVSCLNGSDILHRLGLKHVDVVVGGPPCQGFSAAGKRQDSDERNALVWEFCRIVSEIKPKAFVMENVPRIVRATNADGENVMEALMRKFTTHGYRTTFWKLNAVDYGVPQLRKRAFIVGVLDGPELPQPTAKFGSETGLFSSCEAYVTVQDALSDLPEPLYPDPQDYESKPRTAFQEFIRQGSAGLHNHTPSKHRPDMAQRMLDQAPGTRLYPNWNHAWYKLMLDKPSMTVKENHRAPFVHPFKPRVTTPRECARLQSFSDRFVFIGTKTDHLIQIGNAVPPLLGKAIAEVVCDRINGKLMQPAIV